MQIFQQVLLLLVIIRDTIKLFITKFNSYVYSKSLSSGQNDGFDKRKNFLFNTCGNVMDPANAGKFKFRIPLDHLFNFCKFYRRGIFNAKHELRFTRQSDDMAIFRHVNVPDVGKIRLDNIRWMMPRVTFKSRINT